jgi:molecular chaperone GrpE
MDKDRLEPVDRATSEEAAGIESKPPVTGEATATGEKVSEVVALRREAEEWRAKYDELLDKYKRCLADFANYRKRQERDREEGSLWIKADVLRQFLPVLDDFERALKNVPGEYAKAGWIEGITLIERKLNSALARFEVLPIEALGKPFDPAFHSALMMEDSDEYPPGTVIEELQRGYRLADQVLRPAVVKVSNGPAAQKASDTTKQ